MRETIRKHRKERDRIFKEGITSPLTEAQKAAFDGLSYYDDDPSLELTVTAQRDEGRECVIVETTKHETKQYERYG
jgi:uncharacterized protein (DUF1684 family)